MRLGGTLAPRRKVELGGFAVRCAQSRGEWPGSRRTFLEGRAEGAKVDIEGARDRLDAFAGPDGGARNVEAAEGGGRRVVEGVGGRLMVVAVGFGQVGGDMRRSTFWSAFRLAFGFVWTGGGIIARSCHKGGCG